MKPIHFKDYLPNLSIDCVIFGYEHSQLKVLISKLIYKGDFYALPSGFVCYDEDTENAAKRISRSRTGIENLYLIQFQVFGKSNRNGKAFMDKLIELNFDKDVSLADTTGGYDWITSRSVSIGYYSLVDIKQVKPTLSELDESLEWYPIDALPSMIMDHNEIINNALHVLRSHVAEKLNIFHLLPEKFTMKDIQDIYETILEKNYTRTNFQKKILELNVLERLEKKFTGAKNKAPYLYRYNKDASNPVHEVELI